MQFWNASCFTSINIEAIWYILSSFSLMLPTIQSDQNKHTCKLALNPILGVGLKLHHPPHIQFYTSKRIFESLNNVCHWSASTYRTQFCPIFSWLCIEIVDNIFGEQNFSSEKIFYAKLKFRKNFPTNFGLIRYAA